MKVTLTVIGGPNNNEEYDIMLSEVLIGRDEKCNIQLDSEDVSRVHCALIIDGDEVFLRDAGSSNGTFVNQRRLRGEIQLEDGDSFQVGPQLFSIGFESSEEGKVIKDSDDVLVVGEEAVEDAGQTMVGKVSLIDPDQLAEGEKEQIDKRLKNL